MPDNFVGSKPGPPEEWHHNGSATKANVWFFHYTDKSNPKTFMNATESARLAGFNCKSERNFRSVGWLMRKRMDDQIAKWLKKYGLSDSVLYKKLLDLMDATEVRHFQKDGKVTDTRVIRALSIQLKALELACKIKGIVAPEKLEVTGKDGQAIKIQGKKILENWFVELEETAKTEKKKVIDVGPERDALPSGSGSD